MAGAGYKLFNTGDVLTAAQVNTYLQEQTVMVFADSAARTTALAGVLAEGMVTYLKDTNAIEKYTGAAWVNIDSGSTSPLTTKGDIYTYSTTDARLAVGNNGETLVADSSATTGLRYNPPVGSLANPVINGGFDIWQRGTSNVTTSLAYTADRWQKSTVTAYGVSRQNTNDSTNLPSIQFCARVQRTASSASTTVQEFVQSIESASSIPFAGRIVTLSFWARAGANYSSTSNALTVNLISGTGTDQNLFSGFTGSATPIADTATLTTSWQRFAFSGTIASTATQLAILFSNVPTGTAGANDWFEITGVQVDVGTWTASTAPTFRRSGGTLAGELAACQRYYWRRTASSDYPAMSFGTASGVTTTLAAPYIQFPVQMRVSPTSVDYSSLVLSDQLNANITITSTAISTNQGGLLGAVLDANAASGITAYRPYVIRTSSSTGYLGFSAEL